MDTQTAERKPFQIMLDQLGGNRFIMMVGAKYLSHDKGGTVLRFQFMRNQSGARFLEIRLGAMDTYELTFFKMKNSQSFERVIIKEFSNIYCDQLQEIFTKVTGLATKLF